jgi:GT2 family glycosyltransferase
MWTPQSLSQHGGRISDNDNVNTKASIGVVVINWNGWSNTLKSYESLAACNHKNWTVFIVDNASSDGSAMMIRKHLPDASLIESSTNLGFAGGCNLAISKIIELDLDYVFLLNNDCTVSADSLCRLAFASAALGDSAVLGSVVRFWPSGKLQYFGSRTSVRSGRPHWYTEAADAALLNSELIETDFVFGAALFAPTKLFRKVGLFDERFFLNFEEVDWCYRAAAERVPRYVVTSSVVQHQGSASLGDKRGPLQTYFLSRNRLLFHDKHGSFDHRIRGYLEITRDLVFRLWRNVTASSYARARVDASTRALALSVRDYVLRRFGDCPPEVRMLARQGSTTPEPTNSTSGRQEARNRTTFRKLLARLLAYR